MNSLFFRLVVLFAFCVAHTLGARRAMARAAAAAASAPPVASTEKITAIESKLEPMLIITGRNIIGDVLQFEGELFGKADEICQKIRAALAGESVIPFLLEGEPTDVRLDEETGAGNNSQLSN